MIHQPSNKYPRYFLLFSFLVVALLASVVQAGTLDPTFGTGGVVTTNVYSTDIGRKVFVQPDGKILVVGVGYIPNNNPPFSFDMPLAARYNSDGTLDATFGTDGTYKDPTSMTFAAALLQPDGKIIVVGSPHAQFFGYDNFAAIRLNADGTRDSGFGTGGRVVFDFGGAADTAVGAVLLPDGKLLITGYSVGNSTTSGTIDFVKYNTDGTLDSSFGSGGSLFYFRGTVNTTPFVRNLVLLPDGRIVVLGSDFAARFNADGSVDTSFGVSGFATGGADRFVLQPDGKFILNAPNQAGYAYTLTRRNSDWSVDTGFGVGGIAQLQFRSPTGTFQGVVFDVALKGNGEIYVTGRLFTTSPVLVNYGVARLSAGGTLLAKTNIPISGESYGIALQPDGKVLLTGLVDGPTNSDFGTVRLTNIVDDSQFFYRRTYDFNGDGKDDIAVYRAGSNSVWYSTPNSSYGFGTTGDIIAPGDYTGDGVADLAVFRPSTGYWYIANSLNSPSTNFTAIAWGAAGDVPASGDFDGDGKADVAVFRPSTGVWYIRNSADVSLRAVQWGTSGDIPVVGDYDGDGKCDVSVYRPSNGVWYILRSSDSQGQGTQFGAPGDQPVAADYDGDHKADIAVFRPSTGVWYLLNSAGNTFTAQYWGAAGDTPAPGDYDGDGKTDFAVVRSNGVTGFWYILKSTTGTMQSQQWGLSTDTPVPGR
jgi:uncharacterized delta-60 repeat protein